MKTKAREHLAMIDQMSFNSNETSEIIRDFSLTISPGVWNPTSDNSTLMLIDYLEKIKYRGVEKALDMGTGTGILALLLDKKGVLRVTASDIMEEALDNAYANFLLNNARRVKIMESDLFDNIGEKFDLVVFNAPLAHPKKREKRIGGFNFMRKRNNIRIQFLSQLGEKLHKDGKAVIVNKVIKGFNPLDDKMKKKFKFKFNKINEIDSNLINFELFEITHKKS